MAKPTAYRYFTLNSSKPFSGHYDTSLNAPPLTFANNSSGWIVGNVAPRYGLMDFQTEKAASTMGASHTASNNPISGSAIGDCFCIGPIHGNFAAGNWQVTQSVKANTQGGEQDGRFLYRVYTGSVAHGGNASLVTATFFTSSDFTNLTTTTHQTITTNVTLPALICREPTYIFFQNQCWIFGAGGGVTRDVNYYFGPNSASTILTTELTKHEQTAMLLPVFDQFEPLGQVIDDTFDRPNETPLRRGNAWGPMAAYGQFNLVSQSIIGPTDAAFNVSLYTGYNWSPNQTSQVTLRTLANNTDQGVIVRGQSDAVRGYMFDVYSPTGVVSIYDLADGGYVIIASVSRSAVQAGDTIALNVQGTFLSAYINGQLVLTCSNATYATGSPGVYTYGIPGAFDNWRGIDYK